MKLPFVSRMQDDKLMVDYEEVVYKLECLLCHATGNRLSKHTYSLSVMERAVCDHITDVCDDALQDFIDDKRKEDEWK